MLIHHLVSAGNLHAKDFIIRKKKKKKVQTVVGKDILEWGCEVVSSSERDVVLCNECGKNQFCPGDFSDVVALNSVAIFGIILLLLALRCASILCFVWLCRSFHPW